ncbi:MAG: hypothetical protein U1F98_11400 [Verrucomicrobiota bacterium]
MSRCIELEWTAGHAADEHTPPERWVPARVPGAVQLDWARAENWPPHWQADNWKAYRWMEDVYWTYRATIHPVPLAESERLFLVCGGVDYHFSVLWNGETLHEQEGMFSPFELDLTPGASGGGTLEIRIRPAPKAPSGKDDHTQARLSVKPPVSYGWDWHPRLIPLGIWQPALLEIRPAAHFTDCELLYQLRPDFRQAALECRVSASPAANGCEWRWSLRDPSGAIVAGGNSRIASGAGSQAAALSDPQLWWPHDHGVQPLYEAAFELLDSSGVCLDRRSQRVGFRRVKLVPHPGTWDHPAGFPKSRSHPPVTLEVNGRRIFARGTNWVPPDIFPGNLDDTIYRPLLTLARDAHMNLVRSWGGGIVNKESFFDLCDEFGLLVWQEFPLACNNYEDHPHYLRVLDAESRSIIRRVRRHPCLALWCGGNELFNAWSRMTDQSLAIRLLNRNCLDLDPATPFLPTAPLDGMGHGDYRFRDEQGREVHQLFSKAACTAYSEFGCPGPASVEKLISFIPESELWPVRAGTAWETHHGLNAWSMEPSSWLFLDVIRHYFGEPPDLETAVAQGQWLQAEGYKIIFEEARRQKPVCSMALNWCFNEPWPAAANNSLVSWPADPKPAYHAAAAACRPIMPSARIPKFAWNCSEWFEAELWLFNDSPAVVRAGSLRATLFLAGQEIAATTWNHPDAAPDHHVRGPAVRWSLPDASRADRFTLKLTLGQDPVLHSEYTLRLRPSPERAP